MRSGVFAAALMLAPAALAQARPAYCNIYDELVAAAPTGFAIYRGEARQPGLYASPLQLPATPHCAIYESSEFGIACQSDWGGLALSQLLFGTARTQLAICFAGWIEKPFIGAPGDYEVIAGVRYTRSTPDGELSAGFALTREIKPSDPQYTVGFVMLLIPKDLAV